MRSPLFLRRVALPLMTAVALVMSAAASAPASGVRAWNTPMCGGNDWERVKTPQTEYAVIDTKGACVSAEEHHPVFAVTKVTQDIAWQYPSIIAGYTPEGEPTCASERDTCFGFPVQVKHDGTPEESFGSWVAGGYEGNESNDIWFSPVKDRHSIADKAGDVELMIWFADFGGNGGHRLSDYVTIDGMRFGIMHWIAGGPHQYIAYVWLGADTTGKGHQVNVHGVWLNPFFRNAERHGWLKPDDWLWSIAAGFEMKQRGAGNNLHGVELKDLPVSGPRQP